MSSMVIGQICWSIILNIFSISALSINVDFSNKLFSLLVIHVGVLFVLGHYVIWS